MNERLHLITHHRVVALGSIIGITIVAGLVLVTLFGRSPSTSTAVIASGGPTNASQTRPSGLSDREWEILQPALRGAGRGPEPRAFARPVRPSDTPLEETDLLGADARLLVTTTIGGKTANLYVGRKAGLLTCLILQVRGGGGGGGCNPSANPFGGSHVMWSSQSENTTPQRLILTGVVDDSVGRIEVGTADGKYTAVPLSAGDGFIHTVEKDSIGPSDVPQTIRVFDHEGGQLTDVTLGITFGP